jgi:transposase
MERDGRVLVSPTAEVPVLEGEVVTAIRTLAARGVGSKAIAREVGVARNTVRRYLRHPVAAGVQIRPGARRLTDAHRSAARELYAGPAGGNAVVVQRLLAAQGCTVSVRTIERAVTDLRQAQRASALATVRVETPAGDQLQVDFGQKHVAIGGVRARIFLLVAVLSYSRRLFVKAFLNERGADWREGIAAAFVHFGGVPRTVLGDNARPLVRARDRATGTVSFHPAYLAAATGTCSRGRAPRIAPAPRARPKPA